MGVYIYSIKATTVKTNLGVTFHPSKYSHKPSMFNGFFSDHRSKSQALAWARESKVEQIYKNDPSRWSGVVGMAMDGYDRNDESKCPVGVTIYLYKRENPVTSFADTHDPGKYLGKIKKVGRGKWQWLERLATV